jgi:general secretion pathway protein F
MMVTPESRHQRSFSFKIATATGAIESGVLTAPSRERAIAVLRARGHWPIDVAARHTPVNATGTKLPAGDMAICFRVLATILDAKVPISRVMNVAAPSLPASLQPAVPVVEAALESGETFAASLGMARLRIPPAVVGLLAAGEAAGDLGGALRRAAEFSEKSAAMRAMIINALAYPMLLLAAGVGVVSLLVTVVIPRFAEVLTNLGQELPASTRVVLAIASAARLLFVPICAVSAVALVAWSAWSRSELGKRQWHEFLLRLPLFGALRHALATARSSESLAALIDSGLPVVSALRYAATASGDSAVACRVIQARQQIIEGARIATALSATQAFTSSATRLIGAGESGGALSELLRHAAELEEAGARSKMQVLARVIEPTMILILGAVVSGVAIALLQSVYSVRVDRL